MAIRIVDSPFETHNIYDVLFFDHQILTTVTHTPSEVDSWIYDTERTHRYRLHKLIVGLDVEWRPCNANYPNNPIATLQLCVGHSCLIFQILHAAYIPESLENFLNDPDYTFVGVGIERDVEKLLDDYDLEVSNTVDLRGLAVANVGRTELRNAGLASLASEVLDIYYEKPRRVTLSRWDWRWLTDAQVQYACIDAFLSFEIGRVLRAAD